MNKIDALQLIDYHKNRLTNTVELFNWMCFREIILNLTDDEWNIALERMLYNAIEQASKPLNTY